MQLLNYQRQKYLDNAVPQYIYPMKNKHIVLLFLITLVLGLIARMAPWNRRETLQADLMHVAAGDINYIVVHQPGLAELTLEPGDEGWLTSAGDLTVRTPDSVMNPILAVLAQMRPVRIVHSDRPEFLWLHPLQAVHVEVHLKNKRVEQFDIGSEIMENGQAATYIRLESHEGIYLAAGNLRQCFTISAEAFRDRNILAVKPSALTMIRVCRFGCDTLVYERQDTAVWRDGVAGGQQVAEQQVSTWLGWLNALNGLPFAAGVSLAHVDERPGLQVELQRLEEEPIFLEFYGITCIKSADGSISLQGFPGCAVHSSQNQYNYFELADATLLTRIANGATALAPQR